jgi:hypothetical protein
MRPPALNWDQVAAWRVRKHCLLQRAPAEEAPSVVDRLGGLQAQVAGAAEMALAARVDAVQRGCTQHLLWNDRSLVKTWAFRGTLHYLTRNGLWTAVGAMQTRPHRYLPRWKRDYGLDPHHPQAIHEAVSAALSDGPMLRRELADAVAGATATPHLAQLLLNGWGGFLAPSAYRGELCFGPQRGQHVTFVKPEAWLGERLHLEQHTADNRIVQQYLRLNGAAEPYDIARWAGLSVKRTEEALGRNPGAVPALLEGRRAFADEEMLQTLPILETEHPLRLLPLFDAFTLMLPRAADGICFEERYRARVSRTAGWISPVILQNGRILGVWSHRIRAGSLEITLEPFGRMRRALLKAAKAEAERWGDYFALPVELRIAE